MRRMTLLAAALSLCASAAPLLARAAAPIEATTQLPRNARPSHYDIVLTPDAANLRFDATATITLDIVQPGPSLTLQARDLDVRTARLSGGKTAFAAPKIVADAGNETVTFTFDRPLPRGRYTLALEYAGKIGKQAAGLFAIDYPTAGGKQRALYTQFENSDARAMVPSWDEPAYKATFALSAIVPDAQMAVSNMPAAASTALGDGRKRVRFQVTPKMSTYLLFFALGDFERAAQRAGATETGVVTQRGMLPQAKFALDASGEILREYNDYFGVRYPLPKLDNVAGPGSSQFFGAMENWGAIFTFEHTLLLNPAISTEADRQRIFAVAAHEIAHQWFGDLVTMRWWDDLWLNEGFASWMESRTTARLRPEWNTHLASVGGRDSAMESDALVTTHPIVQRVATVEQASQAFDRITYNKGEAVIGMLEAYVGADAWRAGVRLYMQRHAYGNTASDDLWRAVENAAHKPVRAIAHDFTLQPGVPLIRAGEPVCRDGRTTLALTQDEFTKDRAGKVPLAWRVPVIAQVAGQARRSTLVEGGHATLTLPGCGPVLVNAGQSGYYRTLYAPGAFAALKDRFPSLPAIDQLGLLADTWALGMTGRQSAADFLALASSLTPDTDPQVWGAVAGRLATLNDLYDGQPGQARFRQFAIGVLAPKLARIGWESRDGEAPTVTILRNDLLGVLGALGDPATVREARRRYDAAQQGGAPLPAAQRKVIMRVVAAHADKALWDQLHAQALAEKTPLVRDELYKLLAASEDPALARAALEIALTGEAGATQAAAMLSQVARRHNAMAFDFALAHVDAVHAMVDTSSRSRYIPELAAGASDTALLPKLKDYAERHLAPGARKSADSAAAAIAYRAGLRAQRLPAIDAWLQR
jgi:aminopeptidase N